MPHVFNEVILRQYDIRGTYGDNLNDADAVALGGWLAETAIRRGLNLAVIGKDARASSTPLYEAMVQAMADAGLQVTAIGDVATPELYFAERHLTTGVAVMVTGSHNPPQDNGFKMVVGGQPFFGEDILTLAKDAAISDWQKRQGGSIQQHDIRTAYIGRLLEEFAELKPLKVAFDPANGALCWALQALKPHLPGEAIILNGTADGSFPSHHPDPTIAANLADLQACVIKERCDFGIAFDGDGDRIGIVDDKGDILWGDSLIPLYAAAILAHRKEAVIMADVKAGGNVFANIRKLGGTPQMTPAGHSIIKRKMVEHKALLAGEMTGHIFFADRYYGYDDALYAGLRLWEIIGQARDKLSRLRLQYPIDVSIQEARLKIDEARKFSVIKEIKAYAVKHYGAQNITDIDGVRVAFPIEGGGHGWWLVRAANTESAVSVRAAADDKAGLSQAVEKLCQVLENFDLPSDKLRASMS